MDSCLNMVKGGSLEEFAMDWIKVYQEILVINVE
jgi:hypothetical protein